MSRYRWIRGFAVVAALMGATSLVAQEPKTITEKIKAGASSAVDSVKKGAANAEGAIVNQFNKAKSAIASMGIESRVYSRIHWDKALVGSKIELASPKEGMITLTGTVLSEKAKNKAVELTEATVGVVGVVDGLTVVGGASTEAIKP